MNSESKYKHPTRQTTPSLMCLPLGPRGGVSALGLSVGTASRRPIMLPPPTLRCTFLLQIQILLSFFFDLAKLQGKNISMDAFQLMRRHLTIRVFACMLCVCIYSCVCFVFLCICSMFGPYLTCFQQVCSMNIYDYYKHIPNIMRFLFLVDPGHENNKSERKRCEFI